MKIKRATIRVEVSEEQKNEVVYSVMDDKPIPILANEYPYIMNGARKIAEKHGLVLLKIIEANLEIEAAEWVVKCEVTDAETKSSKAEETQVQHPGT